jgi:uncharacterized protein YyaL (SSP411 family)
VDPSLVLRIKEDYDGAEPSGNSIAILNLLRLSQMTGTAEFRESAERALAAFAEKISESPTSLPQMLVAGLVAATPPQQIVLAGPTEALSGFREELRRHFLPFHALLWAGSNSLNPELSSMQERDGSAAAYVCENFTCKLPVTEARQISELLP